MKKRCANCKFLETDPNFEPCHSCTPNFLIGGEWTRPNFQPARPKREELEARVAELEARLADREAKLADLRGHEAKFIDLRERYDALKSCYMQNEEPDSKGRMFVDFGKVLVKHEAELAELKVQLADWKRWHQFRDEELKVANAELESMHRELADKQAIIDEQAKELAEARIDKESWKGMYYSEERWAESYFKQRDEARRWARKMRDERDEALAACTELADDLETAKRTHTYTYTLPFQVVSKFPPTFRCVKCGQFINWQFDASDHSCPESKTA